MSEDAQLEGLRREQQRLRRAFERPLAPVLVQYEQSMNLARYLQGRLMEGERQAFIDAIADNEEAVAELAHALRNRPEAPLPDETLKRVQRLYAGSGEFPSPVGRSKDVFGEASTSGEQIGLIRNKPHPDTLPVGQPLEQEAPGPGEAGDTRPIPLDKLIEAGKASEEALEAARIQTSGEHGGAPVKVGWARTLLFAFIGAGAVFVLGVVPLLAATRKLFMRARRTEIELAKVNAEFKRVIKDHAQLNKAFRNAKAELAERPTRKAFDRQQATVEILRANFNRAIKQKYRVEEQARRRASKIEQEWQQRLESERAKVIAEREAFEDRFFVAIAGPRWKLAPKTAELVELVEVANDESGVAAFYVLKMRNLDALAVSISSRRPKLTLLHFVARSYLVRMKRDERLGRIITNLAHPVERVRKAATTILESENYKLFGYEPEQSAEKRSVHIAPIVAEWERRNKRSFPYRMSFSEGG